MTEKTQVTIDEIPLDQIAASFGNDRTVFDADKLEELADSILVNGLAQPITLRPIADDRYQIIAGERRYRATSLLFARAENIRFILSLFDAPLVPNPFSTIKAIVQTMDDERAAAIMLAENTARADLDPMDEANAFQRRMTEFGWTIEQVAKQAGKRADYVRRRLALLKLREDLQIMVRKGQFSITYAETLANAELDRNRQTIALRQFNAVKEKSSEVLAAICAELKAQQDQTDMFSGMLMSEGHQTKQEYKWTPPAKPAPGFTPPVTGKTPRDTLKAQIAFWQDAAEKWDRLARPRERDMCKAAIDSINAVIDLVPDHSTARSKRGRIRDTDVIVYALA